MGIVWTVIYILVFALLSYWSAGTIPFIFVGVMCIFEVFDQSKSIDMQFLTLMLGHIAIGFWGAMWRLKRKLWKDE